MPRRPALPNACTEESSQAGVDHHVVVDETRRSHPLRPPGPRCGARDGPRARLLDVADPRVAPELRRRACPAWRATGARSPPRRARAADIRRPAPTGCNAPPRPPGRRSRRSRSPCRQRRVARRVRCRRVKGRRGSKLEIEDRVPRTPLAAQARAGHAARGRGAGGSRGREGPRAAPPCQRARRRTRNREDRPVRRTEKARDETPGRAADPPGRAIWMAAGATRPAAALGDRCSLTRAPAVSFGAVCRRVDRAWPLDGRS